MPHKNGGIEEQIRHKMYRKQIENSRCKSYLISNHIKCEWIKPCNQRQSLAE